MVKILFTAEFAENTGTNRRLDSNTGCVKIQRLFKKRAAKCRGAREKNFLSDTQFDLDHCPAIIDTQLEWEVGMEKQRKQKQAKKTVHITWNEAHRAEADREIVRRARYKSIPAPNLLKLIAASVSRELPKLKATALRFVSVKNH